MRVPHSPTGNRVSRRQAYLMTAVITPEHHRLSRHSLRFSWLRRTPYSPSINGGPLLQRRSVRAAFTNHRPTPRRAPGPRISQLLAYVARINPEPSRRFATPGLVEVTLVLSPPQYRLLSRPFPAEGASFLILRPIAALHDFATRARHFGYDRSVHSPDHRP